MFESLSYRLSKPVSSSQAPVSHYVDITGIYLGELQKSAYLKGKADGAKDMQIELIKRGNALFQLALQKASDITNQIIRVAETVGVTIYDFNLKIDDWDNVTSLITVKLEDYVDEKIEELSRSMYAIATSVNDDSFHWDYIITYASDKLNQEKIFTDGFTHLYEHTPRPRTTQ